EVKRLDELPAAEAFCLYSNTAADEATVQAVCEQLGGWPLALRIAGHYLRSTGESAAEYLRWLEKEPLKELGDGEHQEENAALLLRRSVAQVSDDARLALGVAGTLAFAPIAREPVAAVLENDECRARKALGELVNYGLLEKQEERWQITHALVHTYARIELALSRDSLELLSWYYIACCDELSEAGLKGYARLDGERAHCLRLMESCFNSELWQELKYLVVAIYIYLDRQGWWTELLTSLNIRLTISRKTGDCKDEGTCLNNLGRIYAQRGELEEALICYDKCLIIYRDISNRQGEATVLDGIAIIFRIQGKYELALQYYEQSLSVKQEIGDQHGEGRTLNNLGMLYDAQKDYIQALHFYEQCLPIMQEVGDVTGIGVTLNNIAAIYHAQGNLTDTLKYLKQSLEIRQKLGDRAGEAQSYWNIGRTYSAVGNLAKAKEYINQAIQIAENIGHPSLNEWLWTLEWM
ncbi:MAG: tetratricopeptide repeat protein, partial [Candidatus Electrothrix sp. AX2]|nr:tetratricopeptide repeat protein [Candidatus Electrothrix gigas]